MPKNLYVRAGIYWARFKVRGVEYRESLRTRSERVAVKRLALLREQIEDESVFGAAGPVSWADAVVSWSQRISTQGLYDVVINHHRRGTASQNKHRTAKAHYPDA